MTHLAVMALSDDRKTAVILDHEKGEKLPAGFISLGLVGSKVAKEGLRYTLAEVHGIDAAKSVTVYDSLDDYLNATETTGPEKAEEPVDPEPEEKEGVAEQPTIETTSEEVKDAE